MKMVFKIITFMPFENIINPNKIINKEKGFIPPSNIVKRSNSTFGIIKTIWRPCWIILLICLINLLISIF